MNNKKTTSHEVSTEEDVDIICQQINKNKEEIELFYARNKMKFPPILQSRNIIFKQKMSNYLDLPSQRAKQDENKKSQHSQSSIEKIQGKHFMEKQPSICSIRFSKSKQRRSQHSNARNKNKNTPQISMVNKTSSTPKKYYLSLEKSKDLKFLNEPSSKDPAIEQFLSEMIKNNKSVKKTTFILAKSFEIQKKNQSKRNEPLSINQITAKDPEVLTLSNNFQLHAKKLTIQHQIETERRPSLLPRASRNASCYNNQSHTLRRRQVSQKKQRFFQPWQHQYIIQDDFFVPSKR